MHEDKIVILCISVRMKSQRLPGKALLKIKGVEAIRHLIRRAKRAKTPDKIVLCTSVNEENKVLIDIAKEEGIEYIAGSELDVMSRFIEAIDKYNADIVIRSTGDDILLDPEIVDNMVSHHIKQKAEYTHSKYVPSGVEVEVVSSSTIKKAYKMIVDPSHTEYMTWFLKRPEFFKVVSYVPPLEYQGSRIKLTLDYPEDFGLIKAIFNNLYEINNYFTTPDILKLINNNKILLSINEDRDENIKEINVNLDMDNVERDKL